MFHSYQDMVRIPKETGKSLVAEVYNCDMCDKGGWPSENDVEIHKKDKHYTVIHDFRAKHRTRFCTVCMTLHDSYEALISHIKSQHLLSSPNAKRVERDIYICDECTHIFFNKEVLETHMLYVHLTKVYTRSGIHFKCPKCSKRPLLKSMWFHFQHHEIPSVALCDICLCNFPSRAELYKHIKTHPRLYKCEPCGYNSSKELHFKSHMLKHAERLLQRDKVSSDIVKLVFKKHKDNVVRYNVHNTIKGLVLPKFIEICTLCREICLNHLETRYHVLRDHMFHDPKKKHLCECGEEFYNKVVLKQHVMKMKGSHRSVEDKEETWRGSMASSKTKKILPLQNKLKSVLKVNNRSEAREATSVCVPNDDEVITDEVITPDNDFLNKDYNMINKIDLELCNKVEIEICNDIIIDDAECTDVKDTANIAIVDV